LIGEIDPTALDTLLGAARWLSLNAAEAHALSGESDPTRAAVAALPRVGGRKEGVVVRAAAEGCVVAVGGAAPVAIPGFPAEAVDTTGAGDTHVGAFIAALARGLGPVDACRWANGAAAHVVASRGQVSPPRLHELQRMLAATMP
jgi:sugar/nucleoside kinase (ribokinase family)